jgi:hypothetical protein
VSQLDESLGNGPAPIPSEDGSEHIPGKYRKGLEWAGSELGVPQQGEALLELRFERGEDGRPHLVRSKVFAEIVRRLFPFPVSDLDEAVQLEKNLDAINAKRARDSHNGAVGSIQGWEGGRPRAWSSDERYQQLMEEQAKRLIEEGRSDHEVADAIFGDSSEMYRKRIKRFRAHLN